MDNVNIFISSKMQELKSERSVLYSLLSPQHGEFANLRAWLFESDAPASEKAIREIYLDALRNSGLYIGLFWNEYGEWTIDEFERASEWGIDRHIYVKDVNPDQRDPRLTEFLTRIQDVTSGVTQKWFRTTDELREAAKKSFAVWLDEHFFHHEGSLRALLCNTPEDLIDCPRNLIGRESLRAETLDALAARERTLLQGLAGMGKTALAATVASDWITANKGTVLWLKAGSEEAETLFQAIAHPLDAMKGLEQAENKQAFIRQLLTESPVTLLVIDDAWNGQELQKVIKAVPMKMAVLVTSRKRYPLDMLLDVGQLAPDKAYAVLAYYARRSLNNDSAASELCRFLGYHTYALEIAGNTLKTRRISSSDLLNEIRTAPTDVLRMPEDFAEKGRENISKLLEVSIKSLDRKAQMALYAFGAFFHPSATCELLEKYLLSDYQSSLLSKSLNDSDNLMEAFDMLRPYINPIVAVRPIEILAKMMPDEFSADSWVQAALVQLEESGLAKQVPVTKDTAPYYMIHDLTFNYIRAHALPQHKTVALHACLAYSEHHRVFTAIGFKALRAEIENLMGAADWAHKAGRHYDIQQLGRNLSMFLETQGFPAQAIKLYSLATHAAETEGSDRLRGEHLGTLGNMYFNQGETDRAMVSYQEALTIARQTEDKQLEKGALIGLGNTFLAKDKTDQAAQYFHAALAITRKTRDSASEATILISLGNACAIANQIPEASKYFQDALTMSRKTGGKREEEFTLISLGNTFLKLNEAEQAISYYQEGLILARDLGDKRGEEGAFYGLGNTYLKLNHPTEAIRYYHEALAISRTLGNKFRVGELLSKLGVVYKSIGQFEQSSNYVQQSQAIFSELGAVNYGDPGTGPENHILQETSKDLANPQSQALDAFLKAALPADLRQAIAEFPFMIESNFIQSVKEHITQEIPPEHVLELKRRLEWLRNIAREGKR